MEGGALALLVARPGRLRDGWRALLLAVAPIACVSVADDTSIALRIAKAQSPDLALLDLEPFGTEAWTLLEQIKTEEPRCRCIVLASSTHQLQEAQSAGADAVLIKGFPAAWLFEAVGKLLPDHEPGWAGRTDDIHDVGKGRADRWPPADRRRSVKDA